MTKERTLKEYLELVSGKRSDPKRGNKIVRRINELHSQLREDHGMTPEQISAAEPEGLGSGIVNRAAGASVQSVAKALPEIAPPLPPMPEQDSAIPSNNFIKPTPKRAPQQDGEAPDVAKVLQIAKPAMDDAEKLRIERDKQRHGEDAFRQGREAAKAEQAAKDRAERERRGAPKFFSQRDLQKYNEAQKLTEQGVSPSDIADIQAKKIYGGATNVAADVSGLPNDFLEKNNLTLEIPNAKTRSGLTPDVQWKKLFEVRIPVPEKPAAPMLPGHAAVQNHFGNGWVAQAGETPDAVRARRADLISGAIYGPAGLGDGEVVPNVPGSPAPAGSPAFTSQYGSGFATGVRLPEVTRAQTVDQNLSLPEADESSLRLNTENIPKIPMPSFAVQT